jgi:hypothetical protein
MSADTEDYFDQVELLDDELLSSFPMPQGQSAHLRSPSSHGPVDVASGVGNAGAVESGAFYQYELYFSC